MTWVVGASTAFGYGVVASDICVTFADGTQRDMLQKAYPVGRFIVAGFAGSVRIGFELLNDLQQFLVVPKEAPRDGAWQPEWVAENWYPRARAVFDAAPTEERDCGSEILLVGAHPTEDVMAGKLGRTYVATFRFPEFEPVVTTGHSVQSIGSGADRYVKFLKEFGDFYGEHLQAEVGNPGGWGGMLGFFMGHDVGQSPSPGVSRHIQTFVVRRGEIRHGTTDHKVTDEKGTVEVSMPPVARGYPEFERMLQQLAKSPVAATCCNSDAPFFMPERRYLDFLTQHIHAARGRELRGVRGRRFSDEWVARAAGVVLDGVSGVRIGSGSGSESPTRVPVRARVRARRCRRVWRQRLLVS